MSAKATILATGLALGIGLGATGGYIVADRAEDAKPLPQVAREQQQPLDTPTDSVNQQALDQLAELQEKYKTLQSDHAALKRASANASKPATNSADADPDSPDSAALQSELDASRKQVANLQTQVANLERMLEPFRDELDRRAPSFTFAEGEVLEAVQNANWPQMARATKASNEAIHNIVKAVRRGEQPDSKDQLALQESVEMRRKYEYRVFGKIPSAARFNGENTAPITVSNVFAAQLHLAGVPLNEQQIEEISALGERFNEDAERRAAGYADGTLRTKKLLDEYIAKGAFEDALLATLTPEQREVVVNPETHRVAMLDLNGPTLMLVNTSPILTGQNIDEIKPKLTQVLTQSFQLTEDQSAMLAPLVDAWALDVAPICDPVPQVGYLKSYTYQQGDIAGRATIKLLGEMRRLIELSEEADQLVLDYADFFIPRVLESE